MRPPEQDVTLVLYQLDCRVTNDDGGDEPYMWILGFKVDADTIAPVVGSLLPKLGVQIFEGVPASPYLLGTGSVHTPAPPTKIQPALGTRGFRVKPALLATGDWFSGLAGVIALLWEQDAFSPGTAEAGYKAFRNAFGPALSDELTNLINGNYDAELSKDAAGNVVSPVSASDPLGWRLARLGNTAARNNAVKAITGTVKDNLSGTIKDALKSAAGLDELIDPDDLLGVNAQVYLGQELSSTVLDFSMDYTDNDADYTARGHAFGSAIHRSLINSAVTGIAKTFDGITSLWMRVCWFSLKEYSAFAYRVKSTTRFQLVSTLGEPPVAVRWFLDGRLLAGSSGSITVTFEAADKYFGPPQDVLAFKYPGGPAPLTYQINGTTLDISNTGGEGAYFGTVTALYAFAGDPSISPTPDQPFDTLRKLCYQLQSDLSVVGVELTMDAAYKADVAACKRVIHEIDRKHIAVNYGKAFIDPGDPPVERQAILDRVIADARVANAVGLTRVVSPLQANEREQ